MVKLEEFETKTGGRFDALDLTDEVEAVVKQSGVVRGTALVFSPHTTCSIECASKGPTTLAAIERRMRTLAPPGDYYKHDDLAVRTENLMDDESANAPAHIFHVFEGRASRCIAVREGRLALGSDERVLFIELDRSRSRRYCIQVIGE